MKKSILMITVIFAATLALGPRAFATGDTGSAGTTGGKAAAGHGNASASATSRGDVNDYDRRFVEDAASGGMLEVELGKLAQQKAKSSDVKGFGGHMVTDHSKVNDRLKDLASRKSIDVPKQMNPEHRAVLDQLSKASGADFDRKYMDHMVKDHEKDVTAFEHETRMGNDSDVKQFAEETLPTLREHLGRAQKIDKEQDAAASADLNKE